MSIDDDLVQAILSGSVASVERVLTQNPEVLDHNLYHCSSGYGFALHTAAINGQPEIIKFLVEQKGVDINCQADDSRSTPLHYAAGSKRYSAVAMLLSLGADPSVKRADGHDVMEFCQSAEVIKERNLLDPEYLEKQRRKKVEGTWTKTTPYEIVHDYEQPESRYRLTDTFNFKAGFWRTVIQDMVHNGVSQNVLWFADIPEKCLLYEALEKLKELHGDADETSIEGRTVILNKNRLTK